MTFEIPTTFEAIIFYVLIVDAVCANLVVWFGQKWYWHNMRHFSRIFPPAKGWAAYYLVLVLWIGWLTF